MTPSNEAQTAMTSHDAPIYDKRSAVALLRTLNSFHQKGIEHKMRADRGDKIQFTE